jgi:hypothetical protein
MEPGLLERRIWAVRFDPGNTKRLAALTPVGFEVSLDGGETWMPASLPSSYCTQVVVDPTGSGILALGCLSGLFLSRDWGVTFQQIQIGEGSNAAFDPFHPGWIYAFGYGLALSTDSGQTWTQKTAPPAPDRPPVQVLLPDPDRPNVWYAEVFNGGLWVCADGAASWTELPASLSFDAPLAALSRMCAHGGGLFSLGPGGVVYSLDFGATWLTSPFLGADDVATGPGCVIYARRPIPSNVFVAKLAPGGTKVLWATFLGGSDQNAAQAVALDGGGNLWVLGSTASADFPSTAPRIGVQGSQNVFLASFNPGGALLSSLVIGGESTDTATALTVDPAGSVYVAGFTGSAQFPVTPGSYQTQFDGNSAGFVAKIGTNLQLVYSSLLGGTLGDEGHPAAVAVDAAGQAIVGGTGSTAGTSSKSGFLIRLDPTGSRLTYAWSLAAPAALAMDAQGNLYVEGTTGDPNFPATPGAFVSALRLQACPNALTGIFGIHTNADLFVMKMASGSFQPVYTAILGSNCAATAGPLYVDSGGVATFSASTGQEFPLVDDYQAEPSCFITGGGAISQLSPDGSTLLFSSYVPMCGVPAFAVYPQDAIFAGIDVSPHTSFQEFLTTPHPRPAPPR